MKRTLSTAVLVVGVFMVVLCVALWVAAVWVGGDDGVKLGATGAILIIPSIVLAVIGGILIEEE